jgi:hypothetical protein
VSSLRNSRLAPVHAELAPALTIFGKLFGRALEVKMGAGVGCVCGSACTLAPPAPCAPELAHSERTCPRPNANTTHVPQQQQAQARIALVNTALTAIGMWLLAIPGIGLLSLFVFICR